jgi:hypothetical protein
MTSRGIPWTKIDSDMESDPRLRLLERELELAQYYSAFGAFLSVLLHAGAIGARGADPDMVALLPSDSIQSLTKVGLLDADGAVAEDIFAASIGTALAQRRRDAERHRQQGATKTGHSSAGVSRSPSEDKERREEDSRAEETQYPPSDELLSEFDDSLLNPIPFKLVRQVHA